MQKVNQKPITNLFKIDQTSIQNQFQGNQQLIRDAPRSRKLNEVASEGASAWIPRSFLEPQVVQDFPKLIPKLIKNGTQIDNKSSTNSIKN